MPTNDYQSWAVGGGANVETQAAFVADATRTNGEVSGKANSARANKLWRQSQMWTVALGAFVNDQGFNALDDGNPTNLKNNFESALTAAIGTLGGLNGQCQLQFVNSTTIKLVPKNGSKLRINGSSQVVPSGGVTLSNAGLVTATLYYIYAFMAAGPTMTLEAVTTTHVTSATDGTEIKSGDATRALVGMVFMDAGTPGTFNQVDGKLWVLSWFNRRELRTKINFTSSLLDSTNASHELNGGTGVRNNFLTWGDEVIRWSVFGNPELGGTNPGGDLGIGLDAAVQTESFGGFAISGPSITGILWNMSASGAGSLSEGSHTASVFIANNTGSNQGFNGAGAGGNGGIASTTVVVRG